MHSYWCTWNYYNKSSKVLSFKLYALDMTAGATYMMLLLRINDYVCMYVCTVCMWWSKCIIHCMFFKCISSLWYYMRGDSLNKSNIFIWLTGWFLHLHDSSDGAYSCFQSSPLWAVSVLPFLQQVLAATEVGVFKEDPGPLQNLAGLDFLSEPFVLEGLYAFSQLQRLSVKVKPFIQHELVGPFELKVKKCGQFDL